MDTEQLKPTLNQGVVPDSGRPHAVLLQAPPGDLTGPYPALAYLKASAQHNGFKVGIRDLGIEALNFLAAEHRVRRMLARAEELRKELETERGLNAEQLQHYLLLVSALGLAGNPSLLEAAMATLKDRRKFYDYGRYKRACRLLEAFFRLLSAVHHPTRVSPSEYPQIREFPNLESAMAHRLRSLNPYMEYYEDVLLPQIAEANPSVVGISMVFASQTVQGLVLGRLLKECFPEVHVTMGGAYLSQWVLLIKEPQLADLATCTDSVVCGEGEPALPELLRRIVSKQSLDGVPNLVWFDRATSTVHRFTRLEYADLADLPPPDYSDLQLDTYLAPERIIPYCISRGCYWGRCAFCQNRYGDHRMRPYQTVPAGKACEEMSRLAETYGSHHFNFSNDALDPGYLKRFCETLDASGKRFVWNTDLRAEKAFTTDLCRRMAASGLNSVAIGFESGCQATLDGIDKGYRVDTMRRVMTDLYEAGVATQAMGIFGFPGENEQAGALTVRFLEENKDHISYYVIGLLMVLPGSKFYADPEKYGITSISYEHNPMLTPEPVWRSDRRMSPAAVNRLYDRLSALEEIYAINDYPYVGALSTNHSFLYFRLGPDILKRLRSAESQRLLKFQRLFGVNTSQPHAKGLKSIVPHLNFPYTIHSSPFPIEQAPSDGSTATVAEWFPADGRRDYLVDPVNPPVPISPALLRVLQRTDGRRNLKAILARVPERDSRQVTAFLIYLVAQDLMELPGI